MKNEAEKVNFILRIVIGLAFIILGAVALIRESYGFAAVSFVIGGVNIFCGYIPKILKRENM